MRRRRIWQLAAGGAAIAVAGCGMALILAGQSAALVPDPARARAMMPAIVAYLESSTYRKEDGLGDYSAADYQTGRIRWLCNAALVEVRSAGGRWRAGMDVACGNYERRSSAVDLLDGGDMGHVVMVLSGGSRYQVVSAASEGGISPDPAWIGRHFSRQAAGVVDSGTGPVASMPDDQALLAFGCAADVQGAYGSQAAETWPCRPQ